MQERVPGQDAAAIAGERLRGQLASGLDDPRARPAGDGPSVGAGMNQEKHIVEGSGQANLVRVEHQRRRPHHQLGQDHMASLVHRHQLLRGVGQVFLEMLHVGHGVGPHDLETAAGNQWQNERIEKFGDAPARHEVSIMHQTSTPRCRAPAICCPRARSHPTIDPTIDLAIDRPAPADASQPMLDGVRRKRQSPMIGSSWSLHVNRFVHLAPARIGGLRPLFRVDLGVLVHAPDPR